MPEKSEQFGKYFNLPNPGLRSYFEVVRKGQPDEYRTTFYKGKAVQQVLKEWDRLLKPISKEWPSLYQFESDLGSKVGPMSIMLPLSERIPDIENYYDLIHASQKPIPVGAMQLVLQEWSKVEPLLLRNEADTVNLMKKSTNSGSPYFAKRRSVVDKTVPCTVEQRGKETFQYLDGKEWHACAVLGWRGQEGGPEPDDVKQRVVWMFPFAVNIQELRAYQVLVEAAQEHELVPAWIGMDSVDKHVTQLFDTKGKNDLIVCTDFSKFDQHFNKSCQDAAFYMLMRLFKDVEPFRDWLDNVFPIKYGIPIAIDYGNIRFGLHGMASGSGGTNADETLVHRSLQHEAAMAQGKVLNPNSQCLGDDGILSYPGITVEDVMQAYTAHGLEMNSEKQYASKQDCVYLRRWHHDDYRVDGVCVGVYSTNRALGRLCEQERYYDEHWSAEMVALRQLSIIENCKYHPYRERFVDFCMKGDKYALGIKLPNFLSKIDSIAQEATDYMPDFLGYTKSLGSDAAKAPSGWWITRYLKSKA